MQAAKDEIVIYQPDETMRLDVRLEDETIWLTQKQMGELFGCAPQNITYHIREIFKIGELAEASTCKEFLQVQTEGKRRISRMQKFYNLDAIISVFEIHTCVCSKRFAIILAISTKRRGSS